jgi:pumilio homology domain family member 6
MDPDLNFASRLASTIKPNLVQWATGEGSFVIVGLLETLSGEEKQELVSTLKQNQSQLDKVSGSNKGTKIVLVKIME